MELLGEIWIRDFACCLCASLVFSMCDVVYGAGCTVVRFVNIIVVGLSMQTAARVGGGKLKTCATDTLSSWNTPHEFIFNDGVSHC